MGCGVRSKRNGNGAREVVLLPFGSADLVFQVCGFSVRQESPWVDSPCESESGLHPYTGKAAELEINSVLQILLLEENVHDD